MSADEACCVGTLWYRSRFGRDALRAMLEDINDTDAIDEPALRGNFVAFVRTTHHCLLVNDALGLVKIYVSRDRLFYSTSWLASCAYAGHWELDEVAAAEYVLLGASHSDRTVARGITTLPLAHVFDLIRRQPRERLSGNFDSGSLRHATVDDAVQDVAGHVKAVCADIATAFPGRIRAALSGGFDSRLVLAGLMACGCRPDLFVYGDAASSDVSIARTVAEQLGAPISVIDKSAIDRQWQAIDLQGLVDASLFFDGLPNDGIHDPGADRQTRLQQTADGFVALNGGGGEVFRNFFHLPNRTFETIDIVRAFYRGFDSRVFRQSTGLSRFEEHVASSIRRALGIGARIRQQRLTREQVELIYPLFRCHHWMAVNNSVAARHGYYMTPLVDPTTVRLASCLPLEWKNAGRLESRLIAQLHPKLAGQMSAYGFRFSDGPGGRARFGEWATCMRPIAARPFINAVHRRMYRLGVAPGIAERWRSLLPGEWRLDPVLDLARVPDTRSLARALAVEVACRGLLRSRIHVRDDATEHRFGGNVSFDRGVPST